MNYLFYRYVFSLTHSSSNVSSIKSLVSGNVTNTCITILDFLFSILGCFSVSIYNNAEYRNVLFALELLYNSICRQNCFERYDSFKNFRKFGGAIIFWYSGGAIHWRCNNILILWRCNNVVNISKAESLRR